MRPLIALLILGSIGGMLYFFPVSLADAPLFDNAASNISSAVTNDGYPP
jgi:hypothetical protein